MRSLLLVLVAALVLSACNLPQAAATPTPDLAAQAMTAAAQTVQAVLTQPSQPTEPAAGTAAAAPTQPPAATPTPAAIPSPTPAPPTATISPTPRPCNQATFIEDITIPDGTVLPPNDIFRKTWRLKNVGTCSWTTDYALVFVEGDQMNGPAVQPLTTVVNPGETVDITVELTAPAANGEYRGYWKLRDNNGEIFGLTTGNAFWVDIKVQAGPTSTPGGLQEVRLFPLAAGSGSVYEPGAGLPINGDIIAGDTATNHLVRGYMSFDISALAGAEIVHATLDLSSCEAVNTPFADLSGIWLGVVEYAEPLSQVAYDVTSAPIERFYDLPGTLDVRDLVNSRTEIIGAPRIQFRLHPAGPSDGDGAGDYLYCPSPSLYIIYTP